MAGVAQLVRASDCGPEGRGFNSHRSPQEKLDNTNELIYKYVLRGQKALFLFMKVFFKYKFQFVLAIFSLFSVLTLCQTKADALVSNTAAEAKVSFTFDDGLASSYTKAAPVLAQYGFSGTSYVATGCIDMVTIPNKCAADNDLPYMSWSQVTELQNTYGWEIGAHSATHPLMSEINASKLEKEVADSKSALVSRGFSAQAFATPYGDYNDATLKAIAKYYTSHRGFADTGYNSWPYSNYLLRVQQVQYGVSVDTVKSYIDQAAATNTWLILVFHEVNESPSVDPEDYQYSTTDLGAIASYVKSNGIKVTNVSDGLVTGQAEDNKLTDPTNGAVVGNGWTTDRPGKVKVDTTSKGNAPESKNSIKITSVKTNETHLFSPTISVNPNSTYVIKGYADVKNSKGGELGIYIDEYNIDGDWISGQYMQTISVWYNNELTFAYKSTSTKVAKARLQLIISAASGMIVYVDNIQWLETTSGPAPEPEENLISNGTFDIDMNGWTTDNPSAITWSSISDNNTIRVTNVPNINAHLLSSVLDVSSEVSYTVSMDVNVVSLIGEIGYYVDEYDVLGNWISGQYLYTINSSVNHVNFHYTPSSSQVDKASLQIILTPGTGTEAYLDNVSWTKQQIII